MGISSIILLSVVGPGLVFFMASGRSDYAKSPAGWLLAFPVGLVLAFVISLLLSLAGQQSTVTGTIEGNVLSFMDFCFWNYMFSFFAGCAWRLPRLSAWWAGAVLKAEKKVRFEGSLFVAKNLLEHLLCICYALKVQPKLTIITTDGKEIRGACLKYQWTKPRSVLLLCENENKEATFVLVQLSKIQAVFLENWAEIRRKKLEDKGEYLRLIDDNLPEMLKGKKDACGNMWD